MAEFNSSPSEQSVDTKYSLSRANQLLQEVFGYDAFRSSQADIISSVLAFENTLAIMPTGGGKSLCYQIPALMFDGLTIVISPLISLMQDQVRQLDELNVPACFLNSTLSPQEYNHNVKGIKSGQTKLVFLAPETALQAAILDILQSVQVSCIAIDEAHCISEWGHEFRPEYRQLHTLVERFDGAVCVALTATATPRVREDIKRQLNIASNSEFIASFDRPNLYLAVSEKESPYQQAKAFIDKHPQQSGIIYCQSRSGVDELAQRLQDDGYSALAYHAGLNHQKRSDYQEQFVRDDVQIIVATIAFGMGINKPDVRYVLHYDLPKNIESYYQQIGRAGRDGLDADCLLLFGYGDIGKNRFFIEQMQNEQEKRLATMHLNQMLALAETESCRRTPLLKYFGEHDAVNECSKCDNCLNEDKQQEDLSVAAQKFLSCVYRTGQIFGAGHIVDVLRGSNAEKVLSNRHNLLSTYGIGNEYSKKQWMALGRQLIQKGYLLQDTQYGGLKLAPSAQDVLKGRVAFMARLQKPESRTSRTPVSKPEMPVGDQDLVMQLKVLRKRLADEANVPPYAIFSDRSLQEMAYYFPHSEPSLLQIHGVGQSKAQKYADIFIPIIAQYCEDNNLKEVENHKSASVKPSKASKANDKPQLGNKTREIAQQFVSGKSIAELVQAHKVKEGTIFTHLYKYVQQGESLNSTTQILSEMALDDVTLATGLAAFKEHGTERLKPVFEALGERVSYERLNLLRVYFLHLENSRNKRAEA
ncbi:DNA helicase RecQ [Ningiella sp. W23]|uniref:DNA helicase RecQ n=1 Tax=Ningiella sp. W23 TaxID=3023715 RepID=UPI003757A31E